MSVDRESRIVGAGERIEVDGRHYTLRPIPVRHLKQIELAALREYKREYLHTYRENADILGDEGRSILQAKLEQSARWTLRDLPTIRAFDASEVPINDKVRRWIAANYPDAEDGDEDRLRSLLANALDNGRITPGEVKKMSGRSPREGLIRYDQWWVTASTSGMVLFIVSSLQIDQLDVTEADVDRWPISKMAEASRIVERLTSGDMGNG